MKRLFSTLALTLAAAAALTACGSDHSTTQHSDSSGDGISNAADVTFAQSMIPHHEQAVQMAKMAKIHASSPEVKDLADKIEAAQGPEIATMQGWLADWGQDVPSSDSTDGMSGMDHGETGHGSMPGMMTEADLSALGDATGADFDRMFLTMMVVHHNGAVEMAKTEQSTGKNPEAQALAKKIQVAQTAEIARMEELLKD